MTITRYCYHCGMSHAEEDMRKIATKNGRRWRCIRSIQATRKSAAERDEFGRMVSAINMELASESKRRRAGYEI